MKKNTIRFTKIAVVIVFLFVLGYGGCRHSRISTVETTLGITIPGWTWISGHTEYLSQDYVSEFSLKFSKRGMLRLINEIEQSGYYNLNHDFYRSSDTAWDKSDSTLYSELSAHLKEKHLTGYWIKTDTSIYKFHEPNFGDIPNSAILFDEAYAIEAELNVNEKVLTYRYIKI